MMGRYPPPLPRRCAIRRPSNGPHNPTHPAPNPLGSRPEDVARSRPSRAGARGILQIRRYPSEYRSVPAPLPRRCPTQEAVIRPHKSTPSAPSPLGSRPDVARSRPSRAGARGILQNRARSKRIRVGTRPPPTSVRYTQAVVRAAQPDPFRYCHLFEFTFFGMFCVRGEGTRPTDHRIRIAYRLR